MHVLMCDPVARAALSRAMYFAFEFRKRGWRMVYWSLEEETILRLASRDHRETHRLLSVHLARTSLSFHTFLRVNHRSLPVVSRMTLQSLWTTRLKRRFNGRSLVYDSSLRKGYSNLTVLKNWTVFIVFYPSYSPRIYTIQSGRCISIEISC